MVATSFKKTVCPGAVKIGNRLCSVFVEIKYDEGRLSITGVEGPMRSGDAHGSCGQIDLHIDQHTGGWNADNVAKLKDIWKRWHLNDMRAGCEHQRAENWGEEQIEVITYSLNCEGHAARQEALAEAELAAIEGRVANLTAAGRMLLSDIWFKGMHQAPDADSPLSGLFDVTKRETKYSGHVYEYENPRGVLCKPCPTCGYKYGSAWLREEVPADVLEWLEALPESTIANPWGR